MDHPQIHGTIEQLVSEEQELWARERRGRALRAVAQGDAEGCADESAPDSARRWTDPGCDSLVVWTATGWSGLTSGQLVLRPASLDVRSPRGPYVA
jgi:hypothetical protein